MFENDNIHVHTKNRCSDVQNQNLIFYVKSTDVACLSFIMFNSLLSTITGGGVSHSFSIVMVY